MNWSGTERIVNLVTMTAAVHNTLMLSNNVGNTFFSILDNLIKNPQLIVNPNGESVSTQAIFNSSVENFFKGLFGAKEWESIKTKWKTFNNICSTSAQVLDNTRGMFSDMQEIANTTSGWVAQLGNKLQEEGVLGEDNWSSKPEHPKFKS